MKRVSITLVSETELLAEVPDDWDANEYWNRDSDDHQSDIETLAAMNGAEYEITSIVPVPESRKREAHYKWDGKTIVCK